MKDFFEIDERLETMLKLDFKDDGPATLYEAFCWRCGRTILEVTPPEAGAMTRAQAESKHRWYLTKLTDEPYCRVCLHWNKCADEMLAERAALRFRVFTSDTAVEVNAIVTTVKATTEEISVINDQCQTVKVAVELFDHDAMWSFRPQDDPNALLGVDGNRWLCRGGSVLEASVSGAGKSVARFQRAALYALGLPAFGVAPSNGKKIHSLIVQPENDFGDESEIYQGVVRGISRQYEIPVDKVRHAIREQVIVARLDFSGEMFAQALDKLLEKFKPDLVWIDPIFPFWGRALADLGAFTEFTRNRIQPILSRHQCAACLTHHLEKTGNKYFGPSDLLNWVRADVQISRCDSDRQVFYFEYKKRGERSGVPGRKVYARHDPEMLWWVEVPEPSGETAAKAASIPRLGKSPKAKLVDEMARAFGLIEFGKEYSANEIVEKLKVEFSCQQRKGEKIWATMRDHAANDPNMKMTQLAPGRYQFQNQKGGDSHE